MSNKVLVINLGSTSTKVAVYDSGEELFKENILHSGEELAACPDIMDQKDLRKDSILNLLDNHKLDLHDLNCVISRGGVCKPIKSGIYYLSGQMLEDVKSCRYGIHATSVGCIIASEIGEEYNIPAITANPSTVDEFCTFARYTGVKEWPNVSKFHALNQKAIAQRYSKEINKSYDSLKLIVLHLGGGFSIAAHEKGLIIDVNNGLDGTGPFSPERAGTLPIGDVIHACYNSGLSEDEMMYKIKGGGGLMSHLGTNSGLEVEERINNGDKHAEEVYEAMAYHISKEIGGAAAVLKGEVDAIIFTGSLSYSERLIGWIKERISFIGPIVLMPGENEMLSLAENAFKFLNGEENISNY